MSIDSFPEKPQFPKACTKCPRFIFKNEALNTAISEYGYAVLSDPAQTGEDRLLSAIESVKANPSYSHNYKMLRIRLLERHLARLKQRNDPSLIETNEERAEMFAIIVEERIKDLADLTKRCLRQKDDQCLPPGEEAIASAESIILGEKFRIALAEEGFSEEES